MGFAEIAGQHREAGERAHRLYSLPELGDTHPPQQGGRFRSGIQTRGMADLSRTHAGNGLDRLRRIAFNDLTVRLKAFRAGSDEGPIVELLGNNHVADGIKQGDV